MNTATLLLLADARRIRLKQTPPSKTTAFTTRSSAYLFRRHHQSHDSFSGTAARSHALLLHPQDSALPTSSSNNNNNNDNNNIPAIAIDDNTEKQRRHHNGLILPYTTYTTPFLGTTTTSTQHHHSRNQHPVPIHTVAAPMVAASDYAFRCLCRQHSGVDLTYTQMLHSRNLVQDAGDFRQKHLDLYEYRDDDDSRRSSSRSSSSSSSSSSSRSTEHRPFNFTHFPKEWNAYRSGPVIVQLAGHDVNEVLAAAQVIVADPNPHRHRRHHPNADSTNTSTHVAGIDLNCGCPQGIARKGYYGAYLMERDNARTVCQILTQLRRHLPAHIAVSAKIRLPSSCSHESNDSDPNHHHTTLLTDRIHRLLDTGIDFLTIHGRTLKENKTRVRECHVDRIRTAVQIAHAHTPNFPVIANGGVEFYPDVEEVRQLTGAVAIMSSEALLETPNLFRVDASTLSPRQMLEQQFRFTYDYLTWCSYFPPLPGVTGSEGEGFHSSIVRGHVFKFLHRYLQDHVDIRSQLAWYSAHTHRSDRSRNTHSVSNDNHPDPIQQSRDLVDQLYDRYQTLTDAELDPLRSSSLHSSWYRRHRNSFHTQPRPILAITPRARAQNETIKQRISVLQQQKRQRKNVEMLS